MIPTEFDFALQPVEAIDVSKMLVVTHFVVNKQQDDEAGAQANGKPDDIYERIKTMLPKIAERDCYVIANHIL
jgi:hypothetical protein